MAAPTTAIIKLYMFCYCLIIRPFRFVSLIKIIWWIRVFVALVQSIAPPRSNRNVYVCAFAHMLTCYLMLDV